jgi:putative transmembrane protein PGPGW
MLAVPGPGWITIAAGLTILADEFPWARRALDAIKRTATGWHQRLAKEDRHGAETRDADRTSGDQRTPRT